LKKSGELSREAYFECKKYMVNKNERLSVEARWKEEGKWDIVAFPLSPNNIVIEKRLYRKSVQARSRLILTLILWELRNEKTHV
jgi:hypothetical protein